MLYIYLHIFFALATPPSVQFPTDAQQEQQLWKQQVAAFLIHNPIAKTVDEGDTQAFFIPSASTSAPLLILSSGIHGAEGTTGSVLQRQFLQSWMKKSKNVSVLLIHTINPSGFFQFRRTNANNVDLNRNFFIDPIPENKAYKKMQHLLEPTEPVSTSLFAKWNFFFKVIWYYLINGKKSILHTLTGQNESPKGLYYSGETTQPETTVVQNWILQFSKNFSTILHIDLHTGFGERGKLHLFGSEEFREHQQKLWLQEIFPNLKIDTADDKDFYATHGDFVDWTWKAMRDKKVIPMVFEFGTMDSQTLIGGLESLWISVIENQGFHYGYSTDEDKIKTRKLFEDLFNPQDPEWQKSIMLQGAQALDEAVIHLAE